MNCTDALHLIDALIDGELADRRELDAHVASCAACRAESDARRAFADRLGRDLRSALREIKPAPAEKQQMAARLAAVRPTGRLHLALRVAAVVVIGLSIGATGYLLGRPAPNTGAPSLAATARLVADKEMLEQLVPVKSRKVQESYDDVARTIPENHGTQQVGEILAVYLAGMARQFPDDDKTFEIQFSSADQIFTLSQQGDFSRAFAKLEFLPADQILFLRDKPLPGAMKHYVTMKINATGAKPTVPANIAPSIDILQQVNNRRLHVRQYPNAVVVVQLDGQETIASDVTELLQKHGAVCAQAGITGRDGAIMVGGIESKAMGIVRSSNRMMGVYLAAPAWQEVEPDAERALYSLCVSRKKNEEAARQFTTAVATRAREASRHRDDEAPTANLDEIIVRLQSLSEDQLERAGAAAEKRTVVLRKRLQQLEDLEARVNSVKVYVDALRSLDK